MRKHIVLIISALLVQFILAAPASLGDGGDAGMQGHGQGHGSWKSPQFSGGQSSDFNTGGGMGNGGYDNSHCHNNEGVGEITTIITTWEESNISNCVASNL